MMRIGIILFTLIVSAPSFAELREPSFSDFVQRFENLNTLGWRLFAQQFVFALGSYSIRPNKNGSTWLYNRAGHPQFLMWAYSVVNADKTQKATELSIFDMNGIILLRFNVLSHGRDLQPEDVNSVRMGGVPYQPATNEDFHVMKMWVLESYILKIENTIHTAGNVRTIISKIFADENTLFFKTTEQIMPGFRKIKYDLENRLNLHWGHSSFEVVKTEQEEQIWGMESYYVDEQFKDVLTFRQDFDETVLSFVINRWQMGLGGIVNVLRQSNY